MACRFAFESPTQCEFDSQNGYISRPPYCHHNNSPVTTTIILRIPTLLSEHRRSPITQLIKVRLKNNRRTTHGSSNRNEVVGASRVATVRRSRTIKDQGGARLLVRTALPLK